MHVTKGKFANMAPRYEKIILCRGLSVKNDSQEAYVKTLKTAGYSCDCLPTLRFEFVNISELRECLLSSSSYYGSNIAYDFSALSSLISLSSSMHS